jgi:hypothetical protein
MIHGRLCLLGMGLRCLLRGYIRPLGVGLRVCWEWWSLTRMLLGRHRLLQSGFGAAEPATWPPILLRADGARPRHSCVLENEDSYTHPFTYVCSGLATPTRPSRFWRVPEDHTTRAWRALSRCRPVAASLL